MMFPTIVQQELLGPNAIRRAEKCTRGLSGALVFKAESSTASFCLRRWPRQHPTAQRIAQIHAALEVARRGGIDFVPRVFPDRHGRTFCAAEGHFWELTSWLPGEPTFLDNPSWLKCAEAISKLALLHKTWAESMVEGTSAGENTSGTIASHYSSPAVQQRIERLTFWLDFARDGRQARNLQTPVSDLRSQLAEATLAHLFRIGPPLLQQLWQIAKQPVQLHFVIRDIWSDHVLYSGDTVTGIIDFGAGRIDERAADVTRLLASLMPSQALGDVLPPSDEGMRPEPACSWEASLQAYEAIAGPIDRERLRVLDAASTLLSAAQWWEWLVLQPRRFDSPDSQLLARWQTFVARLELF